MKRTPLKRSGPIKAGKGESKERREAKKVCREHGVCEIGPWMRQFGTYHCEGYLHACHILGTGSHPNIEADENNLVCGCAKCHTYMTNHPAEWKEFVDFLRGEGFYAALKLRSNLMTKGAA